ncbi:phosphotransferase enzyme family protein [Rurimicrobium arvi]|uniref:Phosphotransferase enzyme family protein n=1 Tax=Rurimicrobium arvi TaxID=2049916 RepID=A0ABP8N3V0_9BACT
MSVFPVITSVIEPAALATFIRERYALTAEPSCRLLKTGINHTYRIEAGLQTFVLRVYCYAWRTPAEIAEEMRLLQMLDAASIPVSVPVADKTGNLVQEIQAPEGLRYAVLFSFAKGSKQQQYDAATHEHIGGLMAQIHKVTEGKQLQRTTYDSTALLDVPLERIRVFLPEEAEEMQFLIRTGEQLKAYWKSADSSRMRQGIVHLDIWFDNLNITEDGAVTLFDFDFCGNGWLALDLAYYLMQLYNTEKDAVVRTHKTQAFLKGYTAVLPLSEAERDMLPALGVSLFYFYLGVQCQRFDNWTNTFLNEVYLRRYITVFIRGYYENVLQPLG